MEKFLSSFTQPSLKISIPPSYFPLTLVLFEYRCSDVFIRLRQHRHDWRRVVKSLHAARNNVVGGGACLRVLHIEQATEAMSKVHRWEPWSRTRPVDAWPVDAWLLHRPMRLLAALLSLNVPHTEEPLRSYLGATRWPLLLIHSSNWCGQLLLMRVFPLPKILKNMTNHLLFA